MKKQVSILMLLLFLVGASAQYIALTKEYKKLFKKRNIGTVDDNLSNWGWIKYDLTSLHDQINNVSSYDYDLWFQIKLKEKIYIFHAMGDISIELHQYNFITNNILNN